MRFVRAHAGNLFQTWTVTLDAPVLGLCLACKQRVAPLHAILMHEETKRSWQLAILGTLCTASCMLAVPLLPIIFMIILEHIFATCRLPLAIITLRSLL